ncbi:MAG: 2-C-methyl-D-erythritol 2,4-cyclodiphosphate synthase [Chloroflexota bacterium]
MVGFGYDSHRLAEGESLILGGVKLESPLGTVAHSDGDALLHAIADAVLGAAALGDIGEHFPDTDERWRGANSMDLLRECCRMSREAGYELVNIDCTLALEKPKVSPFKQEMRRNIAIACGLPSERVNVKATTNEKMGFVGRQEGVAAFAVCMSNYISSH